MADLERTIRILFEGDDQVSGVTAGISSRLSSLVQTAQAVAEPLAQAGANVLKLDAALAALAGAGLVFAFNKAKAFESAVIDLDKVLGDGESLDSAKDASRRLADQYGESVNSMLSSMANFKQAGFSLKESIDLTTNALNLQIAGDIDLARSSEYLVAILKGFKAEAGEAGRVVDILNEVSNEYATNVDQLSRGMAGIAPIAKVMGFSFEETAGLLTPIIEVFRSGDEAAIALKTGLLSLQEPSKSTADALKILGVAQKNANGEIKDGKTLFYEAAKGFGTLTDSQKTYVAQLLFGKEQAARMLEVFNNLPGVIKVTDTALNSSGSAMKEVEKRLASAETAVKRFKTAFEQLGIEIGGQFRDSAKGAINGATELELALRDAIEKGALKTLFDSLNVMGKDLETFLRGVAKALPEALTGPEFQAALKRMTESLKGLGGEFGKLFDGIDLTNPKDLEKALVAVVDTVTSLIQVTDGMVQSFGQHVWPAIQEGIRSFNQLDGAQKESIGSVLQLAMQFTTSLGAVVGVLAGVGQAGQDMHKTMQLAFGGIQVAWNALFAVLDMAAATLFKTVESFLAPVVEALNAVGITKFDGLFNGIKTASDALLQAANDDADGVAKGMKRIADAMDGATTSAQKTAQAAKDIPKDITTTVKADSTQAQEVFARLEQVHIEIPDVEVSFDDAQADGEIQDFTDKALSKLSSGMLAQPITFDVNLDEAKGEVDEFGIAVKKTGDAVELSFGSIEDYAKKTTQAVKELPEKKKLELELDNKIDLEKLKQTSAVIQKSIEWEAKINIAQMENDTKRIETMIKGTTDKYAASADVIKGLFSDLSGYGKLDNWDKEAIQGRARQQEQLQRENLAQQKTLIDAQVDYMRKRTENMGKEVPLKVEAAGLEPHLQAILRSLLTSIRAQMSQNTAEMLLGLKL